MIAATDIKDEESLRQWLEEWPKSQGLDEEAARKVAVWVGNKTSLRVLPTAWAWARMVAPHDSKQELELAVLRANLTSKVACACPENGISDTIKAVSQNAIEMYKSLSHSSDSDTSSVAANDPFRVAASAVSVNADFARNRIESSWDDIWAAVRFDVSNLENGVDHLTPPLWENVPPDWFQSSDISMRDAWHSKPESWGFWERWWGAEQNAAPLDWSLLEKIVLIEDLEWKEGARHIASMIILIEAEHAIKKSPNSEEIVQLESGLFDYLPASVHDPFRFKNAIEKVIDTVDEIRAICESKKATNSRRF